VTEADHDGSGREPWLQNLDIKDMLEMNAQRLEITRYKMGLVREESKAGNVLDNSRRRLLRGDAEGVQMEAIPRRRVVSKDASRKASFEVHNTLVDNQMGRQPGHLVTQSPRSSAQTGSLTHPVTNTAHASVDAESVDIADQGLNSEIEHLGDEQGRIPGPGIFQHGRGESHQILDARPEMYNFIRGKNEAQLLSSEVSPRSLHRRNASQYLDGPEGLEALQSDPDAYQDLYVEPCVIPAELQEAQGYPAVENAALEIDLQQL